MNLTDRLITAIVEKCDGLSITAEQASNILAYLQYGAPLPREAATVKLMSDDEVARFFHAIYGTRGFPITGYGARELVHGLQHWLAAPAASNGEQA